MLATHAHHLTTQPVLQRSVPILRDWSELYDLRRAHDRSRWSCTCEGCGKVLDHGLFCQSPANGPYLVTSQNELDEGISAALFVAPRHALARYLLAAYQRRVLADHADECEAAP